MADKVIQRMNYFDRQFLRARDFKDEQAYHLDRRREHNRLLHTPGVAEGLIVKGDAGSSMVTVEPGTAIDAMGREIVMNGTKQITLPIGPIEVKIYILYAERETDPTGDVCITGNTRFTENPEFFMQRISPTPADSDPVAGVLLAAVKLDSNGHLNESPSNDVRMQSGAVSSIINPDQGGSLELGDRFNVRVPYIDFHHGGGPTEDYNVRIINNADHHLTISVPASSNPIGALSIDVDSFNIDANPGRSFFFRARNLAGGPNTLFYIRGDGDVGIGTTTPLAKLDIASGHLHIGGSGIIPNVQGAYISWNITGGKGETDFINHHGTGAGGFDFMNTGNGTIRSQLMSITASGDVIANNFVGKLTGTKVGYVVDQFINNMGEALEQGDVIVIGENQSSLYYGAKNDIPIPEADTAQTANDTRVCGIVCEVYGELIAETNEGMKSKTGTKQTKAAKANKDKKAEALKPRAFTAEEIKDLDGSKIESGQIGLMVTLGAFAHCKVDADIAPIKVGDLLTTSSTKGHAQKVLDQSKALGSIIGKALGSLKKGKGKIPVLVMLQ
jgi:hypothetical protein